MRLICKLKDNSVIKFPFGLVQGNFVILANGKSIKIDKETKKGRAYLNNEEVISLLKDVLEIDACQIQIFIEFDSIDLIIKDGLDR